VSRIESFISAFTAEAAAGDVVERIEIPLIQRDYAQGRRGPKEDEIRETFLEVLHSAIAGADPVPVSLDFVYGEIDHGTLQPLDGQQRLTTLFLLHWYIAVRADQLDSGASWARFSYATRQSARRFCERLVTSVPPSDVTDLRAWITDQSWYLFVWRHDPTIQAMLVMLDAIHQRFAKVDATLAWERLADTDHPAVSFHLLPLPDMGSAEDLYIKMNSRGKPLTDFENFKAHFEKTIETSPRAKEFARKVDVDWSDLLWRFRGNDDDVDDEFLRYLEFATEVCEWSDPELRSVAGRLSLDRRTERVFGESNPKRDEHLDFLFSAFDTWIGRDISATFEGIFRVARDGATGIPLFFRDAGVNLFESCCRAYGTTRGGGNRLFTFGQTLILLAVILHLVHETEDFPRRARVLRNLIEGSTFELRAERMARLVSDTRALILDGTLPEAGSGFSVAQVDDEKAKHSFLAVNPESESVLNSLEDDELLRGSLSGFELDAGKLSVRADAFRALIDAGELWSEAAGALLTVGDYQRARGRDPRNTRSFQFAPPDKQYRDVWRVLLTGATREDLAPTGRVFGKFLDGLANADGSLAARLTRMQDQWLAGKESTPEFDWRYYYVKYPSMREGGSGIYFAEGGELGYSLCNLRGSMTQMNSLYRDPYLLTIWRELGEPSGVADPWFIGYEWSPRWLRLTASGIGIRCVPDGYLISDPTEGEGVKEFGDALAKLGIGDDRLLAIKQAEVDDVKVDSENRIDAGVRLVRSLLDGGF
jgi:hypothetical protein